MALDPEKMAAAGYYHHPDGNGVDWQRDLAFPGAAEETIGVEGYVGGDIGGKLNSLNDGMGMSLVFRPGSVSQTVDALSMAKNVAQIHQYELSIAVDEAHQQQEALDGTLSDAQNRRLDAEIALKNKKDAPAGERAQAALDLQNAVAEEFRAKILAEENAVKYIEADIMLNNGRIWWPKSAEDANKATEYIKQREVDKKSTNQLIASDRDDLSTVTSAIENTKQDIARIRNGEVLDKYRPENEKAAEAKAKADRESLFAKAGVKSAPAYTAGMVRLANAALKAPSTMVLNQTSGSVQMALAGAGTMTLSGAAATGFLSSLHNVLKILGKAVPGGYVISAIFHSPKAGEGSDRVPGRNLEAMFALNAQHLAGQGVKIEPGVSSVSLPVRGQLVSRDGQLALQLLKTGNTALPTAVPVLNAVRDTATGLDRITIPAVGGAPERTILINPAAPPTAPSNTGNPAPAVPVTPVHTGTEVKPVDTITVTTPPAADVGGELQDFIYWRPNAAGTGVEPVYVMFSDPLDSGRFTRKQLDRKYKHAIDFGVNDTKKNGETLTKFRDAIEAHLTDKETVEKGIYRREKGSKVYFNPKTMRVVILKTNGDFLSGWKIDPKEETGKIYLDTGVL